MNKLIYYILTGFLLSMAVVVNAQMGEPVNQHRPTLLVNGKPDGIGAAAESLMNGYGTITEFVNDLSPKQERRILCVESRRDKRLAKLDAKIKTRNHQLKLDMDRLSEKESKAAERRILNLLIDRQQLTAKAKKRILNQLTSTQKQKCGWENL